MKNEPSPTHHFNGNHVMFKSMILFFVIDLGLDTDDDYSANKQVIEITVFSFTLKLQSEGSRVTFDDLERCLTKG
jgi:hypothetical protein